MKAARVLIVLLILVAGGWWFLGAGRGSYEIHIENAVAQTAHGGGLAVSLDIQNAGDPDVLTGVSGEGGPKIVGLDAGDLPIQSGKSSLASDGAHVRLDISEAAEGDLIPLTLTFRGAGDIAVKARVTVPSGGHAMHAGMQMFVDAAEGGAPPTVSIAVAPEADGYRIEAAVENFTFSEVLMDGDHVPGTGHGHLYVGGIKIGRMLSPTAFLGKLPPGAHEVRVALFSNNHRAYALDGQAIEATATIEVDE